MDGKVRLGSPKYMAPELIKREEHDEKVDIWALGVIAFELLTKGTAPFNERLGKEVMFNMIKKKPYNISALRKANVSANCQEFIQACLTKDPKQRPSASELLKYDWICGRTSEASTESIDRINENVVQFQYLNPFQQLFCRMISKRVVQNRDTRVLSQVFRMIDGNQDGQLDVEELTEAMKDFSSVLNLSEQEVLDMFDKLDVSKDGKVEFSEFVTQGLARNVQLKDANLTAVFKMVDLQEREAFDAHDLKEFMNGTNDASDDLQHWQSVLACADLDKNGKVT